VYPLRETCGTERQQDAVMSDRTNRVLRVSVLLLLLLASKASPGVADETLKVPFECAIGKNAFLIHAWINDKPALLILDTSSPETVLQPGILGINLAEFAKDERLHAPGSLRANAISREIELRVGNMTWKRWTVKVMDQSRALSVYLDSPDGVLGLDFLQEFSRVMFDLEGKTVTFIRPPGQDKRHLFGNLRRLTFAIKNGHYILNDIALERVSGDSVEFATEDQSCKVRVAFLETVLVSKGEPVRPSNRDLLTRWSESIPLVSEILKQKDALGSLKPLVYSLIAPKGRNDLQLREQLTLLWSADPADKAVVGHTGFGPPMQLAAQLTDVQYRNLSVPLHDSISKIMLQILYIQDGGRWKTLGSFVIGSNPNGDYEFYLVPRSLLDQIVVNTNHQGNPR
jgi:hypothetical protein